MSPRCEAPGRCEASGMRLGDETPDLVPQPSTPYRGGERRLRYRGNLGEHFLKEQVVVKK